MTPEHNHTVLDDVAPATGGSSSDELRVICPRCGHEDRMPRGYYAGWTTGIRCGLCGPPYVLMGVVSLPPS